MERSLEFAGGETGKSSSVTAGETVFGKASRYLAVTLAALALAVSSLLATGTQMVFQWPGLLLMGAAALMAAPGMSTGVRRLGPVCVSLAVAFAAYVLWRSSTSPAAYPARLDAVIVLGALCAYAVTVAAGGKGGWRLWIGLLVVLGVIQGVIGLYQFLREPSFHILPGFIRTYAEKRASGFYNNPNHFAGFLEAVIPFAFGIAFFTKVGRGWRIVLFYLGLVLAATLAITGSRGGVAGFGASILCLGFLSLMIYRGRMRSVGRIGVLAAVGIVALMFAAGFFAMAKWGLDQRRGIGPETMANSGRVTYWKPALMQVQDQPWTGTGSRTYDDYARLYRPVEWGGWQDRNDPEFAHNDWIQLLGDYGLVGMLLGVALVVAHAGAGIRFLWRHPAGKARNENRDLTVRRALAASTLSVLAAYAVHSVFDFNLHVLANAVVVALSFGFLASTGIAKSRTGFGRGAVGLIFVAAALAAGGGLLWQGARLFPGEIAFERGQRAAAEEEWLEAMRCYGKTIEIDPEHYLALQARATARMNQARVFAVPAVQRSFLERALTDAKDALRLYPAHAPLYLQVGACLDGMGEWDAAEEALLEAVALAPNHRYIRGYYALHLFRRGVIEESELVLLKAREAYEKVQQMGSPSA
ncbi:MAG TPA: O-antigen ligase family protein, partial [Verrucomicrobiales bacterium]|nr:O-antigen ligase family protein [Verrucomicrobiales bacterium]